MKFLTILPWIIGALIVTIFIGRQLTIMELGDDIAKGLGQNINKVRIIIGLLVIILTGMSVSVAGPIGFVGLIVPHIVKRYVSKNYLVMIRFNIYYRCRFVTTIRCIKSFNYISL